MTVRSFLLFLLWIAVASLATPGLTAQPIDSLVARSLLIHPARTSARLATERADALGRSALAWDAPSVGLEFSMLPPDEPNPFTRGETMLMLEQSIPIGSGRRAMARAMEAEGALAAIDLEQTSRELRRSVTGAYYTLWYLRERQAITATLTEITGLLQRTVNARYSVGRAALSDILGLTAEIERLGLERSELDVQEQGTRLMLSALLMIPSNPVIEIVDAPTLAPLPPFDTLAARIATHPDIERMRAMARMSQAESDAQLGMLDPMLMIRGGIAYMPEGHPVREANINTMFDTDAHGGMSAAPMDPMRIGLTAGVMLSIPIAPWSRTGPEERAHAARLQAERQRNDALTMSRNMVSMLTGYYTRARRALLQIDFYTTTQIPLLVQRLDALRGDYELDRVPMSEVVEGYRILAATRVELVTRRLDYANALAAIEELTEAMP